MQIIDPCGLDIIQNTFLFSEIPNKKLPTFTGINQFVYIDFHPACLKTQQLFLYYGLVHAMRIL